MRDELPEGWVEEALGHGLTIDVQPGFACGAHNRDGHGIPHLRPMNVSEQGQIDLRNLKFVPGNQVDRDERLLRSGDVLFNNTNSPELVGKTACYTLPECRAFSNHMTRVRCCPKALDPHYCAFVLHGKWMDGYFASICNNHVSQASISRKVLLETLVPLPPFDEQCRIVARVEALHARVSAARQRLAKLPALLKRFRQAILAAAVFGRLTEDWREQNVGVETADALLQRVLGERFQAWSLAEVAKFKAAGRAPKNESWKTRYKPPTLIDVADLADIPVTWRWTPFDSFVASFQYGPRFGEDEYTDDGIPTVRTTDMDFRGRILLNNPPKVRIPPKAREHFLLQQDDLLVTRTGATIGKCALFDAQLGDAIASAYLIRYRVPRATTLPRYLLTVLMSLWGQRWLVGGVTAVAQPNINTTMIARIPVPLPPLAEQYEIIRRVDALIHLADAIEKRVGAAMQRSDRLTQAILAKAFRGELVPTEAELARAEGRDYEPAAALLERMQAERAPENGAATKLITQKRARKARK